MSDDIRKYIGILNESYKPTQMLQESPERLDEYVQFLMPLLTALGIGAAEAGAGAAVAGAAAEIGAGAAIRTGATRVATRYLWPTMAKAGSWALDQLKQGLTWAGFKYAAEATGMEALEALKDAWENTPSGRKFEMINQAGKLGVGAYTILTKSGIDAETAKQFIDVLSQRGFLNKNDDASNMMVASMLNSATKNPQIVKDVVKAAGNKTPQTPGTPQAAGGPTPSANKPADGSGLSNDLGFMQSMLRMK